jgi:hypothetical protein
MKPEGPKGRRIEIQISRRKKAPPKPPLTSEWDPRTPNPSLRTPSEKMKKSRSDTGPGD